MEIPLTYYTDSENRDSIIQETFTLSGWFTSYAFVQSTETADVIFVSHALSQRYGKTVEKDGSASILFADESRVSEYCSALVADLGLAENQPVAMVQLYEADAGQGTATLISLCAIVVFLIFTSYLLIYNCLLYTSHRGTELCLLCIFLWLIKPSPSAARASRYFRGWWEEIFLHTLVFQNARLMQGCGKVSARLVC